MTDPDRSAGRRLGFGAAIAFLTRIPVGPPAGGVWQLADSAWAFPLVGAGIGAVAAFVFLVAQLIGLGDWPSALLAVLAGLLLTGAIHEDGLADTADGLLGGPDRERKLAIMRDSRHGTYGVLAIVLSVGSAGRCAGADRRGGPCRSGAGRGARRLARRVARRDVGAAPGA